MKSFTLSGLACLLLSAAQVEAIQSEAATQVELEHKHVSNILKYPMQRKKLRRLA
jgi:hypothetical protein